MSIKQYFTCGNNCEICLKRSICQVHEGKEIPVVDFELDIVALETRMQNTQDEKERKDIWEIAKFHGYNFDKYVEADGRFKTQSYFRDGNGGLMITRKGEG